MRRLELHGVEAHFRIRQTFIISFAMRRTPLPQPLRKPPPPVAHFRNVCVECESGAGDDGHTADNGHVQAEREQQDRDDNGEHESEGVGKIFGCAASRQLACTGRRELERMRLTDIVGILDHQGHQQPTQDLEHDDEPDDGREAIEEHARRPA